MSDISVDQRKKHETVLYYDTKDNIAPGAYKYRHMYISYNIIW